jgi:tetratricopeptide (TPR) repeat protein
MDNIETARQLFFDGLAQLEKNDFVTAERLFTESLAHAPQSVSALSNLAIAQFSQKKFAACELTATRLIAANPRNTDGYDILSSSQKEQGKYADALSSCEKTIEIDPAIAEAHCNRAFLLNALGRYREAIKSSSRALAIQPAFVDAFLHRGNASLNLARHDEALDAYDKALSIEPDSAEAWLGRGNVLYELTRHDEALAAFEKALTLDADLAGALIGRGNIFWGLKRYDEASAAYDEALSIAPDAANAWLGRGNVLFDLKRNDEAFAAFDKALSINPDLAGAWLGRGNVSWSSHRHDEALAAFDEALAIEPELVGAWLGRGNVFTDLKRFNDALAAFDRTLSIKPDTAEAWLGRGNAFTDLKRYDDAFAAYGKATSLNPDLGEAHFNEGLLRLLLGDTAIGFKKYEYRWSVRQQRDTRRNFSQPIWLGDSDIGNRTILIHAEQGLGDTLLCCRYVPMVAALGARVILEVQPALVSLLRSLQGLSTLIAKGETIPHFDMHCPMMSLPLAFKTTVATIPNHVPYLSVAPETIERWRSRLAGPGLKVGIAWAGSQRFIKDAERSVLLQNILPLLAGDGVSYFCLQKDLREGDEVILDANPQIVRLDREISDFADTAAIMMSLDVIITSDTAVANLAGALGRKVWVLLPFIPDWRWSLDRDDTPWYPTATLFRQQKIGDWPAMVNRVSGELKQLSR